MRDYRSVFAGARRLLMALTAGAALAGALASAADAAVEIEVLVRPGGGQTGLALAPARLHRDGDVILWNEEARVLVRHSGAEPVALTLVAPSGQSVDLPAGEGGAAANPIVTDWLKFGDASGVSRIVARQGGTTVEHVLVHVSRALAETAGAVPGTTVGTAPAAPSNGGGDAGRQIVAKLAARTQQTEEPRWYATALKRIEQIVAVPRQRDGAKLYRDVAPGVVLVVAEDGLGSGAIVSPQGAVLTNWHVVDGHDTVGVAFLPPLGQTVRPADIYEARVVRVDMIADLALIQINNPPPAMTVLRVGDMDDIQIGAEVHAIGHPLGEFWTYTRGVISQVRPDYEWQGGRGDIKHTAMVLQTQTPLNPGNSGGPLFSNGEKIIGLNSFLKRGQGLGFAVAAVELNRFLAMKESRLAPAPRDDGTAQRTPASRTPGGRGGCEPRALGKRDMDGKSVVAYDTNCNGKPDTYYVQDPGPPPSEYVLVDSDEDGKINRKIVFNVQGKYTLHIFYGGQEGKPTMYGYDYDNDGEIDRFMKPT
jgi:S1-C subfamily serine protease